MKKKNNNKEIIEMGKIIGILVLILAVVYLVTTIAMGEFKKEEKKPEDITEEYIQYNEIIAGEIFTRLDKEYYVLFYNSDGKEADLMNNIVINYNNQPDKTKVYIVDLANNFNRTIYTNDETNLETNNIKELKVKDVSMIKIKDKKNILQITNIADMFKELNK